MSDPVANVEIEDVLSSIRRLVSAEERADRRDARAPRDDASLQDARLVLTPAQRIDDARESRGDEGLDIEAPDNAAGQESRLEGIEDAEILDTSEDHDTAPANATAEADMMQDVPRFMRHGPQEQDEPERADDPEGKDGTAPDPGHEDDAWVETTEKTDAGEPDGGDTTQHEAAPEEAPQTGLDLKELKARIAGFESAVAAQQGEWEPDGGDNDDNAAAPVSPLPWHDDAGDEAGDEGDSVEDAVVDPETETETEHWHERGMDSDDGEAASSGAQSVADAPAAEGGWCADDTVIDEEALRDLVSEIVRQELQGALGERITRNVRKLVRREIHRALVSHGIDQGIEPDTD